MDILKIVSRWIAVLPVWIICLFGVGFLINVFADDILLVQYFLSPAFSAATAMYFAVKIAPNYKRIVAITLFSLSVLIPGIMLTIYIMDPELTSGTSIMWHYFSLAGTIIGAGYVLHQYYIQGDDFDLFERSV